MKIFRVSWERKDAMDRLTSVTCASHLESLKVIEQALSLQSLKKMSISK